MTESHASVSTVNPAFGNTSVDGCVGCFYVLAIVNSAAMNTGCVYLCELGFCLAIFPGVGLLNCMVILC